MNKNKIFIGISILLLIVMACDIGPLSIDLGIGGDSSQPKGGQVEAGVDSPANGASLPMNPVEIAYHATSTEGITAIELSINGEVVSSIASPDSTQNVIALKYTWQPKATGSHTIGVRAQNSLGDWSDFSPSTVNIEGDQQSAQQENPSSGPDPSTPTVTPSPTETPEFMTIFNIEHNLSKFYYGSGSCGSREITISADITHPDDAYAAILFIRFYDNEGEGLTKWDSGRAMVRKSDEHFSVTLFSESIPNFSAYDYAVMYYQIVVQDKAGNRLASSEVIKNLLLEHCP
ncbi:MAG: Ig-like domain-containing protein [Pelolinea sp.]|nr:Ig-like domain-containing protein [Pelolinea sp.]